MFHRRNFLHGAAAAAGAAGLAWLSPSVQAQLADSPPMPDPGLYTRNEEEYWRQIRRQYLLPEDTVYLNVGTVGSTPAPVLRAVFQRYVDIEKMRDVTDPESYPIWGYDAWNEFRDPLAQFIGVKRDELALVRNATEGNSFMANGLDMKPGDEVLMSDQEHSSGEGPWSLRAKRYGIVVKKYEIPKPLQDPADVLNRINDAITPRTRVLFTSHITTTTGVVQPVKEMCALARAKGLVSLIDGAQVPGMMRLNVTDLGCDMYSASPHKWLMAPKGTGFLVVRESIIDRVWSTVTTHGWDRPELRAERFQHIGTSNVPALAGLNAAIELANQIGMERIERRHRALNDALRAEMLARGAEDWTGESHAVRCAMVAVNAPPIKIMDIERALWAEHRIRIRGGAPYKIRLSTPYWMQRGDIRRFLEKFDQFKRSYKAA